MSFLPWVYFRSPRTSWLRHDDCKFRHKPQVATTMSILHWAERRNRTELLFTSPCCRNSFTVNKEWCGAKCEICNKCQCYATGEVTVVTDAMLEVYYVAAV